MSGLDPPLSEEVTWEVEGEGAVGSFQEQKNDSADSQQGQGKELNLANGLNAVGRRLTIRASRRATLLTPWF